MGLKAAAAELSTRRASRDDDDARKADDGTLPSDDLEMETSRTPIKMLG